MRGTTYFIAASLDCRIRTAAPREPLAAYGVTASSRTALATAVASAGVARWEARSESRPALPDLTFSVATPAAPPLTGLKVSVLTRIFFLPR